MQSISTPRSYPRRLLVVDDQPDVLNSLNILLRTFGHEVRTAANGLEAVEVAEAFRPEIIFIDLMMPVMDGFEAARRIRAQPWGNATVLVALTALGGAEVERRTREAGFNYHWTKPVEWTEIEALVTATA